MWKGSRLVVMLGDEAVDGALEVDDKMENTAFQAALGKLGESLDGVGPRNDVGVK